MNKTDRINAELQKHLAEIIRTELSDPRLTGMCTVVKVDTAADLSLAKVYVSFLYSDNTGDAIKALQHSAGYMRNLLKPKMRIRNMPELRFILDESIEYGIKISRILDGISKADDGNKKR